MSVEMQKPKLYSMLQAAKVMGISYNTLYRMVKAGTMPVVNIAHTGNKPIFGIKPEDIQTYYDRFSHSDLSHQKKHE